MADDSPIDATARSACLIEAVDASYCMHPASSIHMHFCACLGLDLGSGRQAQGGPHLLAQHLEGGLQRRPALVSNVMSALL
jgi:hypothetical protein